MREIRKLVPGDEQRVEAFLLEHADTSLAMIDALRHSGLADGEIPFRGLYFGAEEDGRLTGIASLGWNGRLHLQAPVHLEDLLTAILENHTRPMTNLNGPWDQVERALAVIGPAQGDIRLVSREYVMTVDLERLCVPDQLETGAVSCRLPRDSEVGLMAEWFADFMVDLGIADEGGPLRVSCRQTSERMCRQKRQWLLECEGKPVASCGFSAATGDAVLVAGVWTPPEFRSRGYGRCVVAGALQHARKAGFSRAVLTTSLDNTPAQKAYRALGFRENGEFGYVIFRA